MSHFMSTLVINLHPNYENSIRCKKLVDILKQDKNLVIRLAKDHIKKDFTPELIKAEQDEIKKYKQVILLFPVYWYTFPGYSKEYFDLVFSEGFMYFETAGIDKDHRGVLKDVKFTTIQTTGAPTDVLQKDEDLLTRPFKLTAEFSGMKWTEPFIFYADYDDEKAKDVLKVIQKE